MNCVDICVIENTYLKNMKKKIQDEAINLVETELRDYENGTAFITDKVYFDIRNLIRTNRKNYWGVFDKQIDPKTGRKKIWIPLTESWVEGVVKNIDLDTKDVNFRAKNSGGIELSKVMRAVIKNQLDEMGFGEYLDEFTRTLAIDGTAIWKTIKVKKDGKWVPDIRVVDLLNFYIDPTARSIAEASSVIERATLTLAEAKAMKGWKNLDKITGEKDVARIDDEYNRTDNTRGEAKWVEVYERWGEIPEEFVTGKASDKVIQGVITVANAKTNPVVLDIRKDEHRPYEEGWLTRVPGRWYGKGISEKLIMLQLYMNTIVNIRVNRSYVSQLGLFKVRKNRGITPQSLKRLQSNGAILVDSMDDIEQMAIQEASQASYTDENIIKDWANRATQAFPISQGEALPSSATATSAAITSRAGQTEFVLIKKGIGMFIQRWLKNQAIPILMENITRGDVVRITGDADSLKALDEHLVYKKAYDELKKATDNGQVIDQIAFKNEINRQLGKLKKSGSDRFVTVGEKLDPTKFDVAVQVTNEDLDKGVMIQNLIAALNVAPEFKQEITENIFDLMGLDFKGGQAQPVQTGTNVTPPNPSAVDSITGALTQEPQQKLNG